jgi:two-component system LytT family response regulator
MTIQIKSIVVEDQPLAQEKMVDYISKVEYINNLSVFDNCFEALNFVKKTHVDLIFLDIQMDDFDGIQFLESLSVKPHVILTTAYDSYALKGYDLDVADYLLKPISFTRFMQAVQKVYDRIHPQSTESDSFHLKPQKKDNYIFVRSDYKMKKIDIDEILYIESMKDYLVIHTKDQKTMTLMSFRQIENMLPEETFIRIHKSYMVSMNHLDSYDKNIVTVNGKNLQIGETYKQKFQSFIGSK